MAKNLALTDTEREQICVEYLAGASGGELAKKYGITRNTVMGIVARKDILRPSNRRYTKTHRVIKKKPAEEVYTRPRSNINDKDRITLISIPSLAEWEQASAYSYKPLDRSFGR